MKDWNIKNLILLIITIQIIYFSLIILDNMGLRIPILPEVIGFFIVLFIPGTLLLRLLNLDIKSNGEILLYTVGLSVFLLMLIGFLMNTFYPLMGFYKPLSSESIIITITFFIICSSIICYMVDKFKNQQQILNNKSIAKNKHSLNQLNLNNLQSSAPELILILIPLLSILGAYMMNVYQSNILTMFMILLIGIVAFTIGTGRFFSTRLYPLVIFSISIAILLHMSLISNYIWGWDINSEYFLANQVSLNSFWNVSLSSNYNSMLSVVILAPILTSYIKLNLVWILKIVYPIMFSMVPLGLYYVYSKQTCPKIAFYATFFFMILFTFYTEMLSLARQQIAELFLVLLLMVLISDNLTKTKKSFLLVIFGLSIVISHYGLTYIMMIIMLLSGVILYLMDKNFFNSSINYLTKIFKVNTIISITNYVSGYNSIINRVNIPEEPLESLIVEKIKKYHPIKHERFVINPFFISLFILFILVWYFYTSNSSILQNIMGIGQSIIVNLYSIMDPNTSQGLSLVIQGQNSLLNNIHKYLYLISQFFISIGILTLLLGKDGMKFKDEYKALSIATFIILLVGLFLPFFSSQMNTSRLYHIALIIIAPFCIVGLLKSIHKFKNLIRINLGKNHYFYLISIFLVIFLFFDSGLISEVIIPSQDTSIALNPSYDFPKFDQEEVTAGNWLVNDYNDNYTVYADQYRASVLASMIPSVVQIPYSYNNLICIHCLNNKKSYVFMGTWNVEKNQILVEQMIGANVVTSELYVSTQQILQNRSKIYDNGGAAIYT